MEHPDTIEEALEQAVERGARLAAREYGDDWFRHINLDTLQLASARYCILGQLERHVHEEEDLWWGDYDSAVTRLWNWDERRKESKPVLHGFVEGDLPYDGLDEDGHQRTGYVGYGLLQAAWEAKLRDLLSNGHTEV
jgi:hypothetical protein